VRANSFSSGDGGESGDKPVFELSGRVPTTEKAAENTGDKSARHKAGGYTSPWSPVPGTRVGTCGNPVSVGHPHYPQSSPQQQMQRKSNGLNLDCAARSTRLMSCGVEPGGRLGHARPTR